ncbi:MAG: YihA family ribosome biogenesis GTP-binding protein [Alphaproteobacteria bacterium]|nr:YihA family ribosome biogenesis GTP-binding protein [Alphaproteobacteria bacterium]
MSVTEEFSQEDLEAARKLFSGSCDFMISVATLDGLPVADLSEVAFAGRSNVGKSSLINALSGRNTLARTSNTPGRTQQLNYFNLGKKIYLVDMPGYGYAKVSNTQIAQWTQLIKDYLRGRPTLRCVFILIDARHGLKDSDVELMKLLDKTAVSYRIILTKIDKVKSQELEKNTVKIVETLKKHAAGYPSVTQTSALKKSGISELRAVITGYI